MEKNESSTGKPKRNKRNRETGKKRNRVREIREEKKAAREQPSHEPRSCFEAAIDCRTTSPRRRALPSPLLSPLCPSRTCSAAQISVAAVFFTVALHRRREAPPPLPSSQAASSNRQSRAIPDQPVADIAAVPKHSAPPASVSLSQPCALPHQSLSPPSSIPDFGQAATFPKPR
ncbi:hypothetical protein M0R45_006731 [Rubus argutus]|uniref:Uncharacterized protein n=1 Tax=Rubus argutus TaxID=59490 RepID=A0AAW1YRD5_RUBAR